MPKRLKETMIRSDFHMHTAFSTDSEEAVESMLNRAVERGLYSVCITDHMDADYPPDDELGESAFRLDTENYFPFLFSFSLPIRKALRIHIFRSWFRRSFRFLLLLPEMFPPLSVIRVAKLPEAVRKQYPFAWLFPIQ